MQRIMLKSKIHNAVVTEANVSYMGSITIDGTIMDAADTLKNEQVLDEEETKQHKPVIIFLDQNNAIIREKKV